ncbi:MAG: hypothetical protein K2V38_23515, partial [Gemmataceae bacterium]|nr:hypothetical protein [Gemmataceae bacterium]
SDPAGGRQWAAKQVEGLRKAGIGKVAAEDQADKDAGDADQLLRQFRWMLPTALAASVVVFLGGLSIALRRRYRLAQVGCVVAALNFPHLCCVPGALAGLWGLLMLNSDEGREHFAR